MIRTRQSFRLLVPADKPGQQKGAGAPGTVEPPPAFTANLCAVCYWDRGQGAKIGPRLIGVAAKPNRSKDDLLKLLDNPRALGSKNPMQASFPKLAPEDKLKIVEWLDTLKPR